MKYLGIDIGSTSVKVFVLDLTNKEVVSCEKFRSPGRAVNADPNIYQVPAKEYLEMIHPVLDDAVRRYPELEGCVFSTQMHGFVLDDMYISWQDRRCLNRTDTGKGVLEILREMIPEKRMERCGVYLKPSMGLCNLYAKLRLENRLDRKGTLYTLGSYLISELTGENVCHISNAAPLGMADLRSKEWDRELLESTGTGGLTLPSIAKDEFEACGIYETAGRKIKIYPDYGDQQSAILGSGVRKDEAVVNIATASQVATICDGWQTGEYEIRPYFEDKFLRVISDLPAGRHLDVLVRFFGQVAQIITGKPVSLDAVRERVFGNYDPDSHGLTVDPGFYPVKEGETGGSILNITAENLTTNFILAASCQSMAQNYWAHLGRLKNPEQIRAIVCAGGVSWKMPPILQELKRVSERECRLSLCPDEVAVGLFRIAYRCSGMADRLEDTPIPQLR